MINANLRDKSLNTINLGRPICRRRRASFCCLALCSLRLGLRIRSFYLRASILLSTSCHARRILSTSMMLYPSAPWRIQLLLLSWRSEVHSIQWLCTSVTIFWDAEIVCKWFRWWSFRKWQELRIWVQGHKDCWGRILFKSFSWWLSWQTNNIGEERH